MFCEKCGKEVKKEALFCKYCGAKLKENSAKPSEETSVGTVSHPKKKKLFCPKCNTENPEDALLCMKCGERFVLPKKNKDVILNGKKGWLILYISVGIIILGFVGFQYIKSGKFKRTTNFSGKWEVTDGSRRGIMCLQQNKNIANGDVLYNCLGGTGYSTFEGIVKRDTLFLTEYRDVGDSFEGFVIMQKDGNTFKGYYHVLLDQYATWWDGTREKSEKNETISNPSQSKVNIEREKNTEGATNTEVETAKSNTQEYSQPTNSEMQEYPQPIGYVNDFANVISPEYKGQINNLITKVEQKTSAEIAVVTVKTVAPQDIGTYANGLFERWGIGKKGKDNGVLIIAAIDDRTLWIGVGNGLKEVLTDGICQEIYNQNLTPNFKSGNFGQGFLAATSVIAEKLGVVGTSPNSEIPDSETSGEKPDTTTTIDTTTDTDQ